MRPISVAFGIAALTVLLAAQPAMARPHAAERGFDFSRRNCAMCHAIGASGQSPNAMAPPFRELHKRYPVDNLAEALAEGILTGHPQMPEFRLSPAEIDDLIAYLRTLQPQQGATRTAVPSRGG